MNEKQQLHSMLYEDRLTQTVEHSLYPRQEVTEFIPKDRFNAISSDSLGSQKDTVFRS